MQSEIKFHGTDDKHRALTDKGIENNDHLKPAEKKLLKAYRDELFMSISAPRAACIISQLNTLSSSFSFTNWKSQTDETYRNIQNSIKNNQIKSESYKNDLSAALKRFCLWLIDREQKDRAAGKKAVYSKLTREGVDMVKTYKAAPHLKDEDVIMSDAEIEKFIEAEKDQKYKTYFAVLADAGCRPAELAAIRRSDVKTTSNGTVGICITQYKGGKNKRFVPLQSSVHQLNLWLEITDSEYLFPSERGQTLKYQSIYNRFNKIINELGWQDRPFTLYCLRHSRVTKAIKTGGNPEAIKLVFWGNSNTSQLRTYCHLTADDIASIMKGH